MATKNYQPPEGIVDKMRGLQYGIDDITLEKAVERGAVEQYAVCLRNRRKTLGISQDRLAEFAKCSVERISRIETQKNKQIEKNLLYVLAYALSCSPHFLIGLCNEDDFAATEHIYSWDEEKGDFIKLEMAIEFFQKEDHMLMDQSIAHSRLDPELTEITNRLFDEPPEVRKVCKQILNTLIAHK